MKKILLSLLAVGAIFTANAQMKEGAQARVYAYDLDYKTESMAVNGSTVTCYDITFKTNTAATSAYVTLKDAAGNEVAKIDAKSGDSKNWTAEVNVTVLPHDIVAGTYSWEVTATAGAVDDFQMLNDPTNSNFTIYCSYAVAVDNSPESDYFGTIYATNQFKGSTTSSQAIRETPVGIYAYTPEIQAMNNANPYNCDIVGIDEIETKAQGYARDMAIDSKGNLYISNRSDAHAGIYVVNPKTFTYEKTSVASKISGLGIIKTEDDEKLYAVDLTNKVINSYSIGDWNNPTVYDNFTYTAGTGVEYTTSIGNEHNSIDPVKGGFWYCQYNGNTTSNSKASNSSLFFNNNESIKWALEDKGLNGHWGVKSRNGGLAVNEDLGLIAFTVMAKPEDGSSTSDRAHVLVFKYTYTEETGKISTNFIGKYYLVNQGSRSNELAFDYAGNLYSVSSAVETFGVYAIPTDNNTRTTPAKKSLTIEITGDDIATGVDNIAVDANAPVEYYNMQGVKVENPSNGIFIKKQGNKTTKVVL